MKLLTNLLSDNPVALDAFGSHSRIAAELLSLIRSHVDAPGASSPRAIALLGDWGSGKSSVVRMLRDRLLAAEQQGPVDTAFIVYDAWAHEGDGLRRAFLDAVTADLASNLTEAELKAIKRDVWDRKETTTTTSEPILRPHARAFLLSLAPVPFALSLFGNYPNGWPEIYEGAWSFLMLLFLAAPLILLASLALIQSLAAEATRRRIFGVQDDDEVSSVDITSFFFNRVDGQTDHKWTTSPVDSIQQFRKVFHQICDLALTKYRTLVLVIDNIDRLEREEARAFWSTMQAFFDRSGWSNANANRLWLIAPFSPLAVARYFGSGEPGEETSEEARSFIDKSFDLAFHIPPPIQVDSRLYFLTQMDEAFPMHEGQDKEAVRNLYDALRSRRGGRPGTSGDTEDTRKTPRQMKLFINQLVAIYRVADDEIALPAMALYLLLREAIGRDGFDEAMRILGPYELSQLRSSPEAIQQLAAVHFGVSLEQAAQVVLADPIRMALESANATALLDLAKRSGFLDVLQGVVPQIGYEQVSKILGMLSFVERTLVPTGIDLHSTWSSFYGQLNASKSLGHVEEDEATSLVPFATSLPHDQADHLSSLLVEGLSRKWLSDADHGGGPDNEPIQEFEARMASADGWTAILAALDKIGEGTVSLPGFSAFAVRIIDSISRRKEASRLSKRIAAEFDVTSAPFAKRIQTWPGAGEGPGCQ